MSAMPPARAKTLQRGYGLPVVTTCGLASVGAQARDALLCTSRRVFTDAAADACPLELHGAKSALMGMGNGPECVIQRRN